MIVGNGNVALDVARVLTVDPDHLATTDIANHALEALRRSNIREVVVLGRRGPLQAAYTTPEFLALAHLENIDIVVDPADLELDHTSRALLDAADAEPALAMKYTLAQEYGAMPAPELSVNKRIVFRYLGSPVALRGTGRVESLDFVHNELIEDRGRLVARPTARTETIETGLVLRAIGYKGTPVKDLPFDEARGVVPNEHGRVIGPDGSPVHGVYVSGWIKRGPRGVIGSNRTDSVETVEHLLSDFSTGRLAPPRAGRETLKALLAERQSDLVDRDGWKAIDRAETTAGDASGRPRVKLTTRAALLEAARE